MTGDVPSISNRAPAPFAWPPRVEGASDPPTPQRAAAPRPAPTHEHAPALPIARASPPPSPRLAFERAFLGLRDAPWSIRAADAGFVPEPDQAACPRCGSPVGPFEVSGSPPACPECRDQRLPWSQAVRLAPWSGVLREAILEAKYARWHRLAHDLGRALAPTLRRRLDVSDIDPASVTLVPVPMSFRRRWSRGIDHTLAIARGVRAELGCRIARPLWRRHRPPQASLPESGREANVRGCFLPRTGVVLPAGSTVVVLDDVRTTGATLRAACRALLAHQRRKNQPIDLDCVWVATLAVVTPRDRRSDVGGVSPGPQDSRDNPDALII